MYRQLVKRVHKSMRKTQHEINLVIVFSSLTTHQLICPLLREKLSFHLQYKKINILKFLYIYANTYLIFLAFFSMVLLNVVFIAVVRLNNVKNLCLQELTLDILRFSKLWKQMLVGTHHS